MNIIKTYSELITLPTFAERFHFLKIGGIVGARTFGDERYLNQLLYRSYEWKRVRRDVIVRDNGLDLACYGCDIIGNIIVHHINPITVEDVLNRNSIIFDPENLISCSLGTHNAIHYGDESVLVDPIERTQFDTCPWRRA